MTRRQRKRHVVAGEASFVDETALHGDAFNKLNFSNRLSVIPATWSRQAIGCKYRRFFTLKVKSAHAHYPRSVAFIRNGRTLVAHKRVSQIIKTK